MILIGLTTWADHPALINNEKRKVTLTEYAQHFPIVEVDNPFYAIPKVTTVENWQSQVPSDFQFILKANYLMTGHRLKQFGKPTPEDLETVFPNYLEMIAPLLKAKQLTAVLFQFPPYFKLNNDSIAYLRTVRNKMPGVPIAIEFRNPSWFGKEITKDVSDYLTSLRMSEVIVDEPHNLNTGVPFVPLVTDKKLVIIRLQGENQEGWMHQGKDWRKKRTNYCYSEDQLKVIGRCARDLEKKAEKVCIIFNNNGNHDAAPNANQLKDILGLDFGGLSPMQLDLF